MVQAESPTPSAEEFARFSVQRRTIKPHDHRTQFDSEVRLCRGGDMKVTMQIPSMFGSLLLDWSVRPRTKLHDLKLKLLT